MSQTAITIIGALLGPAFVAAVFTGITTLARDRKDKQMQLLARDDARGDARDDAAERDAEAYNTTRASVEAHIRWDYLMIAELNGLRAEVNDLRVKVGGEPRTYQPIPDPPTFFSRGAQP